MKLFRKSETVPMKDQLVNFLQAIEYRFEVLEDTNERTVIRSGISLSPGAADGFMVIHHHIKLVEFFAHSPVNIPENKRCEVAKYTAYVDSMSYIGNFQLNHQRGELRCKTYLRYSDEPVAQDIIRDNYFEGFTILERFMPGIMSIVFAGKDADAAIREILGQVDPTNN